MRKSSLEKVTLFPKAKQLVMMELERISETNIYREWQVLCLGTPMYYPTPSIPTDTTTINICPYTGGKTEVRAVK